MKRIVLIYNPRSSQYSRVEDEVLGKLRRMKGVALGRYEIRPTDVDDNAARIAKILMDGDLVIVAGGDGTASIAMNGIMLSNAQNVKFGVLGYGNYNDMARSFGNASLEEIVRGKTSEVWPLELRINGNHWRYGMCYFTIGMFAESCAVYDQPTVRKKLQKKGSRGFIFNMATLANWWFKSRKKVFMPEFRLGDSSGDIVMSNGASDFMAVNGVTVAKHLRGGTWYCDKMNFHSYFGKMTKFGKLVKFMLSSMFKQIPGLESEYDKLDFEEPAELMIQAEGEYKKIDGIKRIEVIKAKKPIMAVIKDGKK